MTKYSLYVTGLNCEPTGAEHIISLILSVFTVTHRSETDVRCAHAQ